MSVLPITDDKATPMHARAERIRQLMLNWTQHTITLGMELRQARDSLKETKSNQTWAQWLAAEVGMTDRHARSLMQIADRFGSLGADLPTGYKVLELLSRGTTPDAGRREVIRRLRKGEQVTPSKAKKIVDQHRPKPDKAIAIAKETGKPTLASDGFLYFGATKQEIKESTARRTIVYAVRRAISTLAAIDLTPHQFLESALPHQLWAAKEAHEIKDAADWLAALNTAWTRHK